MKKKLKCIKTKFVFFNKLTTLQEIKLKTKKKLNYNIVNKFVTVQVFTKQHFLKKNVNVIVT